MKKYTLRPPEGASFRVDYEKELNPQQLEVVLAGAGPLLVIAGAGSGKTRTLTYRVSRLIESGVAPSAILLVTFTNKAAREMLRRVEGLIQADIRSVVGGTFHHVGNLFLRRHAELVGHRPSFTILDREDSCDLLDDLIAQSRTIQEYRKRPKGDVLLEIISYGINTETDLGRVIADRFPAFLDIGDEIQRISRRYREKKRELNLMDFDDLLYYWREILRGHREVVDAARARFRYLLVDEYQDTNRIQADIVETIAGADGNLMVVGDDAQSIYSFRGANFGNIIDFPARFPSCRIFKLETNYRSTPQVLGLANSSIRHNERQFGKTLSTSRPDGPLPQLVVCGTAEEQATFVAQRMLELNDEDMDLRDMAVLYRAHWHSMELQMELTRRGIPFQVRSGMRFFEQAHIKDIVAYLKIVANPRDELAWKRVLKLYPRIGKATADRIHAALAATDDPLAALGRDEVLRAVPGGARAGWKELMKLAEVLREPAMRASPAEMIRSIVDGGYEDYLVGTYANASARMEDARRFADFAMRYREIEQMISELALASGVAAEDVVAEPEDVDQVTLTSVHQAKGLEWKAVFVIWLVEGKFPDQRALRDSGGEEEERRLFYVSATRARDQLFLVFPTIADERGLMGVIQRSSRFVQEIDPATYEECAVGY